MNREETRPSANYIFALARELGITWKVIDDFTITLNDGQPMTLQEAWRALIAEGQRQSERMATTEAQAGYHRGKADVLLGNEDDPREIGNYYYGVAPADLDKFVLGYRRAQMEKRA